MTFSVYTLSDPRDTNLVRYVGKTTKGLAHRLRTHVRRAALDTKTHKNHWVKSLLEAGLKPVIEEVETFDSEEALNEGEKFYICYLRSLGFKLTNSTDGGDGGLGRFPGPETIAKMRAAKLGKRHSEETKAKLSAAKLGKKFTDEARRNMSAAQKGTKRAPFTEEHKRKIGLANKGKTTMTPEHKAKINSPEAVAKRMASRVANKFLKGQQ